MTATDTKLPPVEVVIEGFDDEEATQPDHRAEPKVERWKPALCSPEEKQYKKAIGNRIYKLYTIDPETPEQEQTNAKLRTDTIDYLASHEDYGDRAIAISAFEKYVRIRERHRRIKVFGEGTQPLPADMKPHASGKTTTPAEDKKPEAVRLLKNEVMKVIEDGREWWEERKNFVYDIERRDVNSTDKLESNYEILVSPIDIVVTMTIGEIDLGRCKSKPVIIVLKLIKRKGSQLDQPELIETTDNTMTLIVKEVTTAMPEIIDHATRKAYKKTPIAKIPRDANILDIVRSYIAGLISTSPEIEEADRILYEATGLGHRTITQVWKGTKRGDGKKIGRTENALYNVAIYLLSQYRNSPYGEGLTSISSNIKMDEMVRTIYPNTKEIKPKHYRMAATALYLWGERIHRIITNIDRAKTWDIVRGVSNGRGVEICVRIESHTLKFSKIHARPFYGIDEVNPKRIILAIAENSHPNYDPTERDIQRHIKDIHLYQVRKGVRKLDGFIDKVGKGYRLKESIRPK